MTPTETGSGGNGGETEEKWSETLGREEIEKATAIFTAYLPAGEKALRLEAFKSLLYSLSVAVGQSLSEPSIEHLFVRALRDSPEKDSIDVNAFLYMQVVVCNRHAPVLPAHNTHIAHISNGFRPAPVRLHSPPPVAHRSPHTPA